jgi:exportin-1
VSFWHFFSHDVLTKTRPMSLQTAEIQVDSNLDFSNFAQYQF